VKGATHGQEIPASFSVGTSTKSWTVSERKISVEMADSDTRNCPYCKEDIQPTATRCKHCGSSIRPESPEHGGTCPYCKEAIHPEAIKCKHCRAFLGQATDRAGYGGPRLVDLISSESAIARLPFTPTSAELSSGTTSAAKSLTRAASCGPCNSIIVNGPISNPIVHSARDCTRTFSVWTPFGPQSVTVGWTEDCLTGESSHFYIG
jgi:Double zinc ribbon